MNEEIITKAIVIKSIKYQENDKILTLFSLELGKISAKIKGILKPTAKLKFAGQLFCFAEFSLIKSGENFTVKTASEIESFFDISSDYLKLSVGTSILEICDKTLNEYEPNATLFLNVIKSLQTICLTKTNPKLVLAKFMLEIFKLSGYELNFEKCQSCGAEFNGKIYLNIETGSFVCSMCKTEECMPVSLGAFNILKLIKQTDYQKLNSFLVHEHHLNEILILFNANFSGKFQIILKSLKNL